MTTRASVAMKRHSHAVHTDVPKPRLSGQTIYMLVVVGVVIGVLAWLFARPDGGSALAPPVPASKHKLEAIPFDGAAAYKYLQALCDFGPRQSGSEGMDKQQTYLTEYFTKLGAKVERQEFQIRHPIDGSAVTLANLIVHWHPERKDRVLLCAHYDTRPYPDRDKFNQHGRFIGANDGASGVAVLMQLGQAMPKLDGRLGVDFVLFDGEELVYNQPTDKYFLGSEHFAREYIAKPPGYRYLQGVLLDMVGDTDLQLFLEPQSMKYAPQVATNLWKVAQRLRVHEFVMQRGTQAVNDDHIPLNEIAKIPTCDVIDFTYPHWHTEQDVPANCSALSLAKVGWVLEEWLKGVVK